METLFYITPLRHIHDATEPDLPEEIPISWVHYAAHFAIVETTIELPASLKAERIRGNLESLLASSRVYPPARALAVIPVEDSPLPWPQLAERLEQLLTHYFRMQSTSGFRLLRCLKDQGDSLEMGGHGGVGHFYWVLAANAEQITWVSDHDFMIYSAAVHDFEIPPDVKLPTELPATPTQQS